MMDPASPIWRGVQHLGHTRFQLHYMVAFSRRRKFYRVFASILAKNNVIYGVFPKITVFGLVFHGPRPQWIHH